MTNNQEKESLASIKFLCYMSGMTHPGGRPRTTTPSPDECIKLGEEYLQWLQNNPGAVHHTEWYSIEKKMLTDHWKLLCDTEQFHPYYQQARHIFAKRMLNGVIKEGLAHRFLNMYLSDLRQEERDEIQFKADASRRSEVQVTGSLELQTLFNFADNQSKDLIS